MFFLTEINLAYMPWTWEEINNDWLIGNKIALTPEEVVAAFNRAEQVLGRDWVQSSRIHSGVPVQGTSPTLHVATIGRLLAAIDGLAGARQLIERLRAGDESAFAELMAVHLVHSGEPMLAIELGPPTRVGNRSRKPDFRAQREGEPWVYVEVAQPDVAETQIRAQAILNRLADLARAIKKSFALEVFLRREPSSDEINEIATVVPELCLLEGVQSKDLPGLAILSLNASPPGQVVLGEYPGEANVPRLGCAKVLYGPDEPHRHIAVRMPYADERADDFLRREARQLPKDSPGLVMVEMSGAPGGIKSWEPLLRRRFQPNLHTRVSAVCLFISGHELTPAGEAWIPHTKLIVNPYAHVRIPAWIGAALTRFESNPST